MFRTKDNTLDLHGEEAAFVYVLVNNFINDSVKIKKEIVYIVHGKSTNILTKEVHKVLNKNKNIKSFKLNNWNLGETIVVLKK